MALQRIVEIVKSKGFEVRYRDYPNGVVRTAIARNRFHIKTILKGKQLVDISPL